MKRPRLILGAILLISVITPRSAWSQTKDTRELRRTPVVEVFERCRDSVVNISTTETVEVRGSRGFNPFEELFNLPQRSRRRQFTRQSVGSGFVVHPRGYIVTNAHVVATSASAVHKVIFADGHEFEARVIAHDSASDLAVLKIKTDSPLPTMPFGGSSDLMVGETVIAIGNPLGYQHTVTTGVVSATGRDIELNDVTFRGLIQTDASINPGNSGGPLLNVLGELIGVNTAIRGDAENIGFAIPVDRLREILPELLDVNRRYRIETGLTLRDGRRPEVTAIRPGSPAEDAGLRIGDVLLEVDGAPVRKTVDYYFGLVGREPGEAVRLRLERGGRSLDRAMVLSRRPDPDARALASEKLGLEVVPLPDDLVRDLRLPVDSGLLIARVEPGGPADQVGIERRDVLLSLGRFYVAGLDDLGQLLETVEIGEELSVSVIRVNNWGKTRLYGRVTTR